MAAESPERGASGAGGRARSRSSRGPELWRGGTPEPGLGGLSEPLTPSPGGGGPGAAEHPLRALLSPPPPRSLRRPREATAREEAPRNKGTRRRWRRARGAAGRAPSSPLPACRKVDGLEDETPGSRARSRPRARDPTPPLPWGSRGLLAALSWPSTSDWGPAFAWEACWVRAWMEEASYAAASPPPSGLLKGGQSRPQGAVGCPPNRSSIP